MLLRAYKPSLYALKSINSEFHPLRRPEAPDHELCRDELNRHDRHHCRLRTTTNMMIIATGIISASGTVGMIVDVDHDHDRHDRHDRRRRQLRRRAPRRNTPCGIGGVTRTRSALFLRQGRQIPHVRGTPLPQIGICGFDGEKLTQPASDILGIDELSR